MQSECAKMFARNVRGGRKVLLHEKLRFFLFYIRAREKFDCSKNYSSFYFILGQEPFNIQLWVALPDKRSCDHRSSKSSISFERDFCVFIFWIQNTFNDAPCSIRSIRNPASSAAESARNISHLVRYNARYGGRHNCHQLFLEAKVIVLAIGARIIGPIDYNKKKESSCLRERRRLNTEATRHGVRHVIVVIRASRNMTQNRTKIDRGNTAMDIVGYFQFRFFKKYPASLTIACKGWNESTNHWQHIWSTYHRPFVYYHEKDRLPPRHTLS